MTDPVLVAGAGPVGLIMAAELARYRVPVRVIDKSPARSEKSKALAVWARTMELLDRAGCAEAFAAAGVHGTAMRIQAGQRQIAHVSLDGIASSFPYLLLLPQSESERLLEAHLESLGGRVERNVELTGFAEAAGGVSCTLRHADGHIETAAASWLIGCDGAHSTVRHQLGMEFEGDTLETHFILADVHAAGLNTPATELAMFWHENGALIFFPIAPGRYRIIADIGTEPRHDPSLAEVQAIVDRRGPGGITLSDPVWLAGFRVNERKVKDYRAGRVFLAGDAAHVHSPAGGQGMNTGMQDACNLAWKLALVRHGLAGPGLLNSYSTERSPIAKQILAESGQMTRVATVRSHLLQDLRNLFAHQILGFSGVRHALADRLSELTIGYPESPLSAGSGAGLNGPGPGQRIVSGPPFGAGERPRFALMAVDTGDALRFLKDYPELLEPALRPPPDAAGIWLVRPDGYVATATRAGEWEKPRSLLARLPAWPE
jgi:2-polyprenyl-6-methoxyphenol hydroxylase-like FAD-dependent oxidoreductase